MIDIDIINYILSGCRPDYGFSVYGIKKNPLDYYLQYRICEGLVQVKNKKNYTSPLGVEPKTSRLVVKRSILLSYGEVFD